MNTINEIKNNLSVIKNFYDTIRIIDPIQNKVIISSQKDNTLTSNVCFDIWNKSEECQKCIAKDALLKNDTFFRIDIRNDKIFLVIASPIIIENKTHIIEIIKDISLNVSLNINDVNEDVKEFAYEIKDKLFKDSLTDVYNRQYIYDRLNKLLSSKENLICSLIMLDIDHFKRINDNYGHIIGDKILRDFCKVVSNILYSLNKETFIGRYGGEEFLIALINIDSMVAYHIAEKIRKTIEKYTFTYNNIAIKLTCSLGIYTLTDNNITTEDFISSADRNLYIAKKTGRNKIIISTVIE